MTIDLTPFSELMAVVVVYYVVLFLVGARGVRVPTERPRTPPLVVIIVPAHNESLVVEGTLRSALSTRFRGPHRVLLMDDASEDDTAALSLRMARTDYRLRVFRRPPEIGGRGKSEVLNHAYWLLAQWQRSGDPWLRGYAPDQTILCVVDADGRLSPTALEDATAFFTEPRVGAVQVGVKIRNARQNLLARMQDMEFVGFSFMVQTARDRIGSVGLGGNGQFTRMSALAGLGWQPWSPGALTEDLDLGIRLMTQGWRLRFCSTAWVDQQGLVRMRPLLRQRTRWAQGHYQCWRHVPRLLRSPRLRILNRLDSIAYLLLIVVVLLVTGAMGVRILATFDVLRTTNEFLPWLGSGLVFRGAVFALSWLPMWLTLLTYQRFATHRLRWWEWPAYSVFFAAYVYLWALATVRAWCRFAVRRGNWVKTPRLSTSFDMARSAA